MAQPNDIAVFITTGDATCADCGEDLGRHAWIMLDKEHRALCLACADLDHLVFLPAGGYGVDPPRPQAFGLVGRGSAVEPRAQAL